MTPQEIKDQIGRKDGIDIRDEVMTLCGLVDALQATVTQLQARVERLEGE